MRPLLSYDDIASEVPPKEVAPSNGGPATPPKKRRKTNHHQGQRSGGQRNQSREEDRDGDEVSPKKLRTRYGLQAESRQLTHDEVWDDSALIRAWDAAVEEYEVLNGPDKKWKSEPVNKSPLWYNIPPEIDEPSTASPGPSFLMPSIPAVFTTKGHKAQDEDVEPADPDNSRPVNFDTFVPHYDPSLPNAEPGVDGNDTNDAAKRAIVPPRPAVMTSRVTPDAAFQQAMGAWYWAGYWTGVYHSVADKTAPQEIQGDDARELDTADEVMIDATEAEEQAVPSEEVEENDLIPT